MADYPRLSQSPFFKTFATSRTGNVPRNHPLQRGTHNHASEPGSLQHYPMMRGILTHGEISRLQRQSMPSRGSHVAQPMTHNVTQPTQQNMLPHQPPMPQATSHQSTQTASAPLEPQILPPQTAAERFQRVNRGLPDGVQFEPLDEETKAILRQIGKDVPTAPANVPPSTPLHEPNGPISTQPPTSSAEFIPPQPSTGIPGAIPAQLPTLPPGAIPSQLPTLPPGIIPPQPLSLQQNEAQSQEITAIPPAESAALLEKLIQDDRNASIYYQHLSEIAPGEDFKGALQGIIKDCDGRQSQYHQILQTLHDRGFEPKNNAINTTIDFDQGIEMAILEERKILESMAELIEQLIDKTNAQIIQNLLNKRMIHLSWLQWAMFRIK